MKKWRKEILICAGSGCISSGERKTRDAIIAKIKEHGLQDEIKVVETGCIGACALGPRVLVNPEGVFYEKVSPDDAEEIVAQHLAGGKYVERLMHKDVESGKVVERIEDIDFFKYQKKIALRNCGLIDPMNIDDYIQRDGYKALQKVLTSMSPDEVIDTVTKSGLAGRGGAGFSTGMKWRFVRQAKGTTKYVICNADEGDPGAFMDRSVLEGDPHSVVEAMTIAGYATGAKTGYIYVRAEYPLAIERLTWAIKQAKERNYLGKNIFGTDFEFDLDLRMGAGAFVCGEETTLLTSIEGHRGEPRPRPPFPAVSGLYGCPTLINNVETYANITAIILNGADWFAGIGTEKSKGTKVFALVGSVNNTGLVEVPMGTTLREIVYKIGGGMKEGKKFKAAQIGGPSGGCIPYQHIDLPIDYQSMASIGAIVGSGGLIITDEDTCIVDFARYFMEFTQSESCGKCPPCRIGTKRILEILTRITQGRGKEEDLDTLVELSNNIKNTALCGLGQTSPNPVLTTLKFFRDEYLEHIRDKHCRAGVCKRLAKKPAAAKIS